MKQLFLLALLLSIQLYGQIEKGTYYSEEVIYCDIWEGTVEHESYNEGEYFYIDVNENGIRIYNDELIGQYYPWIYIGIEQEHHSYLLHNRNRAVWSDDFKGIILFYDLDKDSHWYRKSVEYRNVKKINFEEKNKQKSKKRNQS